MQYDLDDRMDVDVPPRASLKRGPEVLDDPEICPPLPKRLRCLGGHIKTGRPRTPKRPKPTRPSVLMNKCGKVAATKSLALYDRVLTWAVSQVYTRSVDLVEQARRVLARFPGFPRLPGTASAVHQLTCSRVHPSDKRNLEIACIEADWAIWMVSGVKPTTVDQLSTKLASTDLRAEPRPMNLTAGAFCIDGLPGQTRSPSPSKPRPFRPLPCFPPVFASASGRRRARRGAPTEARFRRSANRQASHLGAHANGGIIKASLKAREMQPEGVKYTPPNSKKAVSIAGTHVKKAFRWMAANEGTEAMATLLRRHQTPKKCGLHVGWLIQMGEWRG